MRECDEQREIVAYFRERYPQYAMSLRVSQTGGHRGKGKMAAIRNAQVKGMGGVVGEADIAIMLPRGGYGSLIIEHKATGGKHPVSKAQQEYIDFHNAVGNCAIITRGIGAAIAAIDTYMAKPDTLGYSQSLIEYLEDHESDIAREIKDFANLRTIFKEAMGRNPIK